MRSVGQYKGVDIKITHMYLSDTYGGFLLGPSAKKLEMWNHILVDEKIPERIVKLWGIGWAYHLMEIDYKKELPSTEVIARLECPKGIKEKSYVSGLVMAWYQEPEEDPFDSAVANLKQIVWEKEAKDFEY